MTEGKGRQCVTHFHACDCREEMFKELQSENERLKARCEKLREALREVGGAVSFTIGNRYLQPHIYSTVTLIIDKALADDGGG